MRWTAAKVFRLIGFVTIAVSIACPAWAQIYPNHVIKLVVPFSAGGQPDTIARLFAQSLSASVGPTIIDNRPGANTTLGARAVATAEPDGYTLLFGSSSSLALAPALNPAAGYDPVKSFAPIAMVSSAPFILTVGPSVPAKSISEFMAYARANPAKLNFAAPTGGPPHLAGEWFKRVTGVNLVPISYRSMNQAVTDLISGQMDIIFDAPAILVQLIREKKISALVVMDHKRAINLPDVPTMAEAGLPNLQLTVWNGIVAPAGTPAPILRKLNAAINDALDSPEIIAALENFGSVPLRGTSREFSDFIASEADKWGETVRASGIKME
jgi:tripartite-type tricarboxylate transporter receptor subunit TctC